MCCPSIPGVPKTSQNHEQSINSPRIWVTGRGRRGDQVAQWPMAMQLAIAAWLRLMLADFWGWVKMITCKVDGLIQKGPDIIKCMDPLLNCY